MCADQILAAGSSFRRRSVEVEPEREYVHAGAALCPSFRRASGNSCAGGFCENFRSMNSLDDWPGLAHHRPGRHIAAPAPLLPCDG